MNAYRVPPRSPSEPEPVVKAPLTWRRLVMYGHATVVVAAFGVGLVAALVENLALGLAIAAVYGGTLALQLCHPRIQRWQQRRHAIRVARGVAAFEDAFRRQSTLERATR